MLQADYIGPDGSSALFTENLEPLPANYSTKAKTEYLSALRASITKIQGDINTFLTQKMDEDKQSASSAVPVVDDAKEEENYGEEVVDSADAL